MEGFIEIVSIFIGRYVFGKIGSFIRKVWSRLLNINNESVMESGINEVVDVGDFKNRLLGFSFISILIIIIMLLSHYL